MVFLARLILAGNSHSVAPLSHLHSLSRCAQLTPLWLRLLLLLASSRRSTHERLFCSRFFPGSLNPVHSNKTSHHSIAEGLGATPDASEMDTFLGAFDATVISEFERQIKHEQTAATRRVTTFGFLDLAPFIRNSVEAIQQDSFTQCFQVTLTRRE